MTGMQNKELSFVMIELQLIGWHPVVNIVNAWLNAQFRCSWFSSSTRLERQINLAIISIKMMVHVVFTDHQLVMFLIVFYHWMYKKEIQLLSGVFCYSWLICLLGFWLRNTSLVKVGNPISDGTVFVFDLAWCVRGLKSLKRYWPYLIALRSCILNGKPE